MMLVITPHGDVDDNSCVEGSIIGGILGGGAGAASLVVMVAGGQSSWYCQWCDGRMSS